MLNKEQAHALIESAINNTKYYAVAVISETNQGTTRFANSEISQNVVIKDGSMTLALYNGQRQASCTTNALTESGVIQLVKDAESILEFVPEGEFGAFPFSAEPVPECISNGFLANAFDTNKRALYIKEGVAHLEEGYTASGALTLTGTVVAVGESGGGFRYASYDNVSFNTVVSHTSGADGGAECISYTAVPDIVGCFKKAQITAKAAINPTEPPLGAVTVVLSPTAFADLITFSTMPLSGKAVEDGFSYATGKLGKKLFGKKLTISDNVTHPGLCPLPFDVEGNPRRVLPLIKEGVVSSYVYDNKNAAKHGVQSTGHAAISRFFAGAIPMNIVVDGGALLMSDIIKGVENGIYINEFHYTNTVNPRALQITGLTRNGAFLIENGQLTKPISTVRFTESLLEAFNNITAISKEREIVSGFGAMLVPGVRIDNFHFTSKA